jgi:hypothetical protein
MGHHLLPRSIASALGITSDYAWYPNNTVGSGTLHQQLHNSLISEGIPYHGSRYTGTLDEFWAKAGNAYEGFDNEGYLKKPGTNDIVKRGTPKECLDHLEKQANEAKKKNNNPLCRKA